jgi:excisionase family DNA binding protein
VAKGWGTIQEVADILNISRDTVERWINTGALRAVDMSARKSSPHRRTWRVSATSLDIFLETRTNVAPIPKRAMPRKKKPDVIEFIK